jgi:predicted site-specific integrase-resolvase
MQAMMMPFRQWLKENGIGRTKGYQLAREGKIHPKKVDGKVMITMEEAERYVNSLPDYKPATVNAGA